MATITIRGRMSDGSEYQTSIEATLVGALAVHLADAVRTLDGKAAFSITHVASGRRMSPLYFEDMATAVKVAELIGALPVDFSNCDFMNDAYVRPHLGSAIKAVSALHKGFVLETPIDAPIAGTA